MENRCVVTANFRFWIFDVHGRLRKICVARNAITNAALNYIPSAALGAGAQLTTWSIGLIDATNFDTDTLDPSDTMASHTFTEFTAYDEATRQLWTPGTPGSGRIINPTRAIFTANAGGEIAGAFLVSNNTKGGATGTLFAHGEADVHQIIVAGERVRVDYATTFANG
jgi:hypothetical protein